MLVVTAVSCTSSCTVTLRFQSVDASRLKAVARWVNSAEECREWAGPGVGFPATGESVARDILAPDTSEYGLLDADRIVAFGQLIRRTAGRIHLARLIVHPRRRGQGLGASLLQGLIAEARNRGADIVSLNVDPNNLPAVSIYARAGFTEAGAQPREDGMTAMELALD